MMDLLKFRHAKIHDTLKALKFTMKVQLNIEIYPKSTMKYFR